MLGLPVHGRGRGRRADPAEPRAERLVACEGLDARIVDLVRAAGGAVPELPRGDGLAVRRDRRGRVGAAPPASWSGGAIDDPAEAAALWRIREDGAGLAARSLDRPAYSGWEDAAVPPDRLGAWLREFDELLEEHGLRGVPYGHFGDGCVHVRIDFEFDDGGRRPVPRVPGGRGGGAARGTAGRCRASTATAGRGRSCCR